MPSAILIEFNQEIIQNRQSRGIAEINFDLKYGEQELEIFW